MHHKVACHQSLGMHINICKRILYNKWKALWDGGYIGFAVAVHALSTNYTAMQPHCNCTTTPLQLQCISTATAVLVPFITNATTNTVSPALVPAHCRKWTGILPSYLHVRALIPLFPELHGMPLSLQRHVHPSDLCKPGHSLCTSLRLWTVVYSYLVPHSTVNNKLINNSLLKTWETTPIVSLQSSCMYIDNNYTIN